MVPRVYLGMANLDISKRNLNALEVILEMHHQGKIKLFTSTVTKKEIEKIPASKIIKIKGWEMNIKWLLITGAIFLLFFLLYVKLEDLKDFIYYWMYYW